MPRIRYEKWNPGSEAQSVIRQAESICTTYQAQGYDLTLRQLYYQFVARGLIPNTQREYNRLGTIINRARMSGYLDWDYIVDRTRNIRSLTHWESPEQIVKAAASSFRFDGWANQGTRIEVWVEKEALAGIVGQVAEQYDVSWFSCRGYVSQSELWGAAQRILPYIEAGQHVVILHLGDHDPSGIDMTRDINDRMTTFLTMDYLLGHQDDFGDRVTRADVLATMSDRVSYFPAFEIRRIALNMDQVEQYDPPPNPAKLTDSRADSYIREYGRESWELDALDPNVLSELIEGEILAERNEAAWEEYTQRQESERVVLSAAAGRWDSVKEFLNGSAAGVDTPASP